MYMIFVLFGVIAAIAGGVMLTQATMGSGLIALACFLGILARLTQAETYERNLKKRAAQGSSSSSTKMTSSPAPAPMP